MNDTSHSNHNKPLDQKAGQSRSWWAAMIGLLTASAVPCPECGGPLALHIWPLILVFIAVRALVTRSAKNDQNALDNQSDSNATEKG